MKTKKYSFLDKSQVFYIFYIPKDKEQNQNLTLQISCFISKYIKQIQHLKIVNMIKMTYFHGLAALIMLTACSQTNVQEPPLIKPTIETPKTTRINRMQIIGEIEPIYFAPMKTPISARIDTGAEQSALDADNIKYFERDGEKWISFDIINRETGEKQNFKKKIIRHTNIKRIHVTERRPVVEMNVKFGNESFKANFSLAKRDKFEYQALIGRNILTGRAIVDTSVANTLR